MSSEESPGLIYRHADTLGLLLGMLAAGGIWLLTQEAGLAAMALLLLSATGQALGRELREGRHV